MKEKLTSFFSAIGYLSLTFSIQLIVSLIGSVIITIAYLRENDTSLPITGSKLDEIMNKITESTNYILLISSIITVLVFLLIYKIRKKNLKKELKIVKTIKINIILGIILGISAWLFNTGAISIIKDLGILEKHFLNIENFIQPLNNGNLYVSLLTIGIVVPFTEEFIFRGIIFNTLNKNISILWTIIIQAILFGLLHRNLIQGVYATLLGVIFGYITYKTRSLYPSIVMHIINNTLVIISSFIFNNIWGNIYIYTIFMIIGFLGLIILFKFINENNSIY